MRRFGRNPVTNVDRAINIRSEVGSIGVPWSSGRAVQASSASSLAAREQVSQGGLIYRTGTTNVSGGPEAQYWDTIHPLSPGYAKAYGVPQANIAKGNFITAGRVPPGGRFVTRPAPLAPGAANRSGPSGIEVVVDPNSVVMQWFSHLGGNYPSSSTNGPGSRLREGRSRCRLHHGPVTMPLSRRLAGPWRHRSTVDLVDVESQESAPLVEGDAPLADETPHVSHRHPEGQREIIDGDQAATRQMDEWSEFWIVWPSAHRELRASRITTRLRGKRRAFLGRSERCRSTVRGGGRSGLGGRPHG